MYLTMRKGVHFEFEFGFLLFRLDFFDLNHIFFIFMI